MTANQNARRKFTVRPVYRAIVKKNERQAGDFYDVLVCGHAVLADRENTFRRTRPCSECRVRVQEYAERQREARSGPAAGGRSRRTVV